VETIRKAAHLTIYKIKKLILPRILSARPSENKDLKCEEKKLNCKKNSNFRTFYILI